MTAAIALSAMCFFLSIPLASRYARNLYDMVFKMEGTVYRQTSTITGTAGNPAARGTVHRGNQCRTGAEHLELTVSHMPSEILYLKGFSGGEYTGGEWMASDDEILFVNMQETLGWEQWGKMIGSMYRSLYFVMNSNMKESKVQARHNLTIRHCNNQYETVYVPYYSQPDFVWNSLADDENELERYGCQYYEQGDMEVQWDQVSSDFEQPGQWYRQVRDAYKKEIEEAYTKVPREALPRLTAFVEEHPREGLDEISSFILYTLHENAAYTLTPGWTPVEVTPAPDGTSAADYPGFDRQIYQRMISEGRQERSEKDLASNLISNRISYGASLEHDGEREEKDGGQETADLEHDGKRRLILEVVVLYSLCLLPFFLDYRRLRILRHMESENSRRVFSRFMEMLHAAGILLEYDGSEEEFAFKLEEEVMGVSRKEIKRLQELVCRAAYDPGTLTEEEERFVRKVYIGTAAAVYEKLKWNQKWVFRYLRCFV